jgi:drug/metabolite transporter (DMT)-like permease
MGCANLLFPFAFLYVSEHHFSPFQTSLARGVSICVTHIVICLFFGISLDFKSTYDLKYLFIRNSLMVVNQVVYTGMHFVLSFPLINSISITGPLIVFIIDYYLNGVTINRNQVIGIIIGFVGILININGDFLMTLTDETYEPKSTF